jgi:hypothetical protein
MTSRTLSIHFSLVLGIIVSCLSADALAKSDTCRIEKKATVQIGYAGTMMTVLVSINGTSATMGLDTGAQTLVTPEAASRLHLPRDYHRKTRAFGTTAVLLANNVIIRDLEFAGKHHDWKSVAALSLTGKVAFGSLSNAEIGPSGLLGADILSNYDLDFDFSKSTLTLYSVSGCSKMTPPWTGNFIATPIGITPQRRVLLPVEIDGVKLSAIFDTGAFESALTRSAAFRLGLTKGGLKSEQSKTFVGVGNVSAELPTHRIRESIRWRPHTNRQAVGCP